MLEVAKGNLFNLKELVVVVNRLLPNFVRRQTRYKVTTKLSQRTVRHYLSLGLLDRPLYYTKGRALFGYRHVLQLLVIKYFQSQYLPLKKIALIMEKLSTEVLEKLLFEKPRLLLGIVGISERDIPLLLEEIASFKSENLDKLKGSSFALSGWPNGDVKWSTVRVSEKLELRFRSDFYELADAEINGLAIKSFEIITMTGRLARPRRGATLCVSHGLTRHRAKCMRPATPLKKYSDAVIALVTEGGLVPKGNPDKLEGARAGRFLRYKIQGLDQLKPGEFESVDRGWDTAFVNEDPNRLLPLDVIRELEKKGLFPKVYDYIYTTSGVGTPIDVAQKIGQLLALELKEKEVSAVVLTST